MPRIGREQSGTGNRQESKTCPHDSTKIKFYDPNDPKYLPGSPTYIGPKKN